MPVTEVKSTKSTSCGVSPAWSSALRSASSARLVPTSMNTSFAALNPPRSRYASSGSAVCRVPMPLPACMRSSTARRDGSGEISGASSCVISACVYTCGGSTGATAAMRVIG
jgi:hypothetical protein